MAKIRLSESKLYSIIQEAVAEALNEISQGLVNAATNKRAQNVLDAKNKWEAAQQKTHDIYSNANDFLSRYERDENLKKQPKWYTRGVKKDLANRQKQYDDEFNTHVNNFNSANQDLEKAHTDYINAYGKAKKNIDNSFDWEMHSPSLQQNKNAPFTASTSKGYFVGYFGALEDFERGTYDGGKCTLNGTQMGKWKLRMGGKLERNTDASKIPTSANGTLKIYNPTTHSFFDLPCKVDRNQVNSRIAARYDNTFTDTSMAQRSVSLATPPKDSDFDLNSRNLKDMQRRYNDMSQNIRKKYS